jgi:hypothetical protein
VAKTHPTLLIANNNKRGKAEPAAALDDLSDPVDMDETVHKLAVALFAVSTAIPFACHLNHPSCQHPCL